MAKIAGRVRAPRTITEMYSWCNFTFQFPRSFHEPLPPLTLRRSQLVVGAVKVSPVVRHPRRGENADGGRRSKLPLHVWDSDLAS